MTPDIDTPRRGRGQPPKGDNARTLRLAARVTAARMRRIRACASLEGMTVSDWLLSVCARREAEMLREVEA